MRLQIISALTAMAVAGVSDAGLAQPSTRSNIVYTLADDLSCEDVGFHGPDIKTPNLDRLAETGAKLEHFRR